MEPNQPTPPDDTFELLPRRVRAYLYRVLTAASPVIAAYGIVEDSKLALWVGLAGAVLGTGTAAVHTSTKP